MEKIRLSLFGLRAGFTTTSAITLRQSLMSQTYRILYWSVTHNEQTCFSTLLKLFTGQGQTRFQEFEQLYKLLCKLAKHVTLFRRLIEAAVLLPQDLGQDFTVKTIPTFGLQKLPLSPKEANVESTVGQMFSSSEEQNKFLVRLRSVWDAHELSTRLQEQITTKTRVHAELLLVNYFDKYGCTFLDGNDRYIGCSKPACYLCYAYIVSHPGRYALPASHQKL
jgi:hypothetical protein